MEKKKEKKKVSWQGIVVMALFMLVGGVCGFLIAEQVDTSMGEGKSFFEVFLTILISIVGLYAAFMINTILHEAGHLIFGLASGYKFSSFRIMSFMWVKEEGKLRFRRLSIAGTGGQCLMIPPELDADGMFPVMLYNLGGPVMNLILGVLFLVLYLIPGVSGAASAVLLVASVTGFVFAIINGVPMRLGGVDNDGYNAFSLGKNREAIRAFWLQMKMNGQIADGIRLKDMPDEWFEIPSDEAMKNSMVSALGVFVCNRLVDEHKFEEADRLMEHMMSIDSGIIGLHRNLMVCDRMYIELITENRREVIEEMRSDSQIQFMKSMKTFPSVIRTEYVYALLFEKDGEKAAKLKAQFEKRAKSYPYPNEIQSERELIEIADSL